MTTMPKRAHNFGAGPAVLPLSVLEKAQAELLDYAGTGMSVMEISHRSAAFEGIIQKAEADLRTLLGVGADHAVLFLQGGASLQFAMIPANLRPSGGLRRLRRDRPLVEGRAQGGREVRQRARGRVDARRASSTGCRPRTSWTSTRKAAYLHFTANNTIYGTEWPSEPEPPAGVPLVCDASSNALSRPVDIAALRALLRRGAEEHRTRGCRGGRDPQGPAGA